MEDTMDFGHDSEYCHSHGHHIGLGVKIAVGVIFGLVFGTVLCFALSWVAMLLWNWLLPGLFGVKIITFWQAFGVLLLAKLLFGGCGWHGRGHHRRDWRFRGPGAHSHHGPWAHDDTWKVKGSYRNWEYYDQYWKEEGKAAFESYIDKMEDRKRQEGQQR
jgi:hypothetical protein